MSFNEHARQIAPPIAAYPAKTLFQVFRTVLEGCLYLASLVILHGNLPIIRVHPASNEVVVVGVELEISPCLVREAIGERVILQNTGAVCNRPT